MRLSRYFLPLLKETPSEARIASHRLMLRAGLVRQSSAGIYSWLPLGLAVMQKIAAIVREEQNRIGALEMLMPTIQPAALWQESGRYEDYGEEMLRLKDRHGVAMLYGPTNEEQVTQIFRDAVRSWRDVPRLLYHIQWKFRDEIRPRFGVMRGREFLMKDAYSFDLDEAGARRAYHKMFLAYLRSFHRMGLTAVPVAADTGPIGGDLSHEFVVPVASGESELFCHADLLTLPPPEEVPEDAAAAAAEVERFTQFYAASDARHDAAAFARRVPKAAQFCARGIEIGHIFYFGEKYSAPMGCRVQDESGKSRALHCGSYGIGISRLVGAIIEASHDARGIIWPWAVAPFRVGLVCLQPQDEACRRQCEAFYAHAQAADIEVLYDDREERAGPKFHQLDLTGLPWQAVIGPREAAAGQVELKARASGARRTLPWQEALAQIQSPPPADFGSQAAGAV